MCSKKRNRTDREWSRATGETHNLINDRLRSSFFLFFTFVSVFFPRSSTQLNLWCIKFLCSRENNLIYRATPRYHHHHRARNQTAVRRRLAKNEYRMKIKERRWSTNSNAINDQFLLVLSLVSLSFASSFGVVQVKLCKKKFQTFLGSYWHFYDENQILENVHHHHQGTLTLASSSRTYDRIMI